MRRVPVVVAPVSQRNCTYCHQAAADYLAWHLCQACGKPQPLPRDPTLQPDYFSVFGVKSRFGLDLKDLELRFYKLSRALHPDRFTALDADSKKNSLERMGLVNQAYQTLKSSADLRDYVLQLEGLSSESKKGQIPMELTEAWFEIQDLEPADIGNKLDIFLVDLREIKKRAQDELRALEAEIDREAEGNSGILPRSLLEKLSAKIQAQSYLNSMERDVLQKKESLR